MISPQNMTIFMGGCVLGYWFLSVFNLHFHLLTIGATAIGIGFVFLVKYLEKREKRKERQKKINRVKRFVDRLR